MNQPSGQEKTQIISQILNSPEFHDSKRYQELLQYLINKSEQGETIKETEIAHDLFSKDSKFDPSVDSLIRSYISNLRKKLEHYYLTTSDKYNFRLEIPKGQYHVKYIPLDPIPATAKKINYYKYIFPSIIFLLLLILIIREFQHSSRISASNTTINNPIWKEFLQSKTPLLIALGDYVVLSEKGKMSGRNFIRVPGINNEKELSDSSKKFPKKFNNMEISEVTYIGAGAALGISHLFNFFSQNKVRVTTKLSREITWDDIEKYNIIFIGSLKTLYKLDTLLVRTNIKYQLNPNSLSIKDRKTNKEKFFSINWHGGNYERNFGLIIKQYISKQNNFILLTGFSEVGVMDAVKNILDSDFESRIEKFIGNKLPDNLPQFEFLTEAEGLRYNVLRSQIKHFSLMLE